MRRREFISLLGGAVAMPFAAHAQQKPISIGLLGIGTAESNADSLSGFHKGLAEAGFVDGRNLSIDMRWAKANDPARLGTLASELIGRRVAALIATGSALVAQAAKAATSNIPILFANGSDPVKVGLVASMNRPGGNATGVTFFTSTLGPKRLELLRELVPHTATIAFLVNPTNPVTSGDVADMENAARSVNQRLVVVGAKDEPEIDNVFAAIAAQQAGAVLVNVDAFFNSRRQQIAALASRYKIPSSYNNSQYVKAGGLISYGDDRIDSYRQLGVYTGRILRGEKPADLPVMQPTKFSLAINLKTAKALGLAVPPLMLTRADEVIE